MSHSIEQMKRKQAERAEAMEHLYSNVNTPRNGVDHDEHKFRDMVHDRGTSMTDEAIRGICK